MSKSSTRHTRRKRRQAKMTVESAGKFKLNHKSRFGRTGRSMRSMHSEGARK